MKMRTRSASSIRSNDSVVSNTYLKIKHGLKKSNPAAIVLWAFHKIPCSNGLTSRRVINFLKKHFRAVNRPEQTGKSIGAMLRCAVEFGLLKKRGTRYFLTSKTHN